MFENKFVGCKTTFLC